MVRFIIIILCFLSTSPLSAEEAKITKEMCRNLVSHHPDEDVAYKPEEQKGVPADLNRAPLEPEDFTVHLNLDENSYQPPLTPGYQIGATPVSVDYKNGTLYYKGRPLQPSDEAEVHIKCQEILEDETGYEED